MAANESDIALLLSGRELWLLVSAGFVDPYHAERLSLLGDPAFRCRAGVAAALLKQECPEIQLGPGESSPQELNPEALFQAFDSDSQNVERAYRGLFGLTISQVCPPCGIEYEPNTDVTYRAQQMADIAGFYRAFELEVSGSKGERQDHVTVEAEFLSLLNAKEAAALAVGKSEQAEICRSARKKFFQEHVGWWMPAFTRRLAKTAGSNFYRSLAALTSSLLPMERASLEIPPFTGRVVPNVASEPPGLECLGCSVPRHTP